MLTVAGKKENVFLKNNLVTIFPTDIMLLQINESTRMKKTVIHHHSVYTHRATIGMSINAWPEVAAEAAPVGLAVVVTLPVVFLFRLMYTLRLLSGWTGRKFLEILSLSLIGPFLVYASSRNAAI